jgi:hypothetical protein
MMRRLTTALLAMTVVWVAATAGLPKGPPSENLLAPPCSKCVEAAVRV